MEHPCAGVRRASKLWLLRGQRRILLGLMEVANRNSQSIIFKLDVHREEISGAQAGVGQTSGDKLDRVDFSCQQKFLLDPHRERV
jgi:hypothetical protein